MNYLQEDIWKSYYEEIDPEKRCEIFRQLSGEAEDDSRNVLRKKLFKLRHTDPKRPDRKVDLGVWQMVVLPAHLKGIFSMRQATINHIRESMTIMGMDERVPGDEVADSIIYWEIRNTAKRYLSTCDGPKYARKLFGVMASSDEEKLAKTAKDIWMMTAGVPQKFAMEEEMQIFCDAVKDEFFSISEQAKMEYEDYDAKEKEKKGRILWRF